jgi:hypothetical protein
MVFVTHLVNCAAVESPNRSRACEPWRQSIAVFGITGATPFGEPREPTLWTTRPVLLSSRTSPWFGRFLIRCFPKTVLCLRRRHRKACAARGHRPGLRMVLVGGLEPAGWGRPGTGDPPAPGIFYLRSSPPQALWWGTCRKWPSRRAPRELSPSRRPPRNCAVPYTGWWNGRDDGAARPDAFEGFMLPVAAGSTSLHGAFPVAGAR